MASLHTPARIGVSVAAMRATDGAYLLVKRGFYHTTVHNLISIIDDTDEVISHFVLMCYSVEVDDVEPVAGDDALEARFFTLAEVRGLNVTPSTLEIAEDLAREHLIIGQEFVIDLY